MMQKTIAIFVIFLIGINLAHWTWERTNHIKIWRHRDELDEETNFMMAEVSKIYDRAVQGMELSQHLLEKKVKNIFMNKLKERRNLSEDEVFKLKQDPDEFKKTVDDDIIADFILSKEEEFSEMNLSEEDTEEKEHDDREYEQWIKKVIERVEKWE